MARLPRAGTTTGSIVPRSRHDLVDRDPRVADVAQPLLRVALETAAEEAGREPAVLGGSAPRSGSW